MAFLPVVTKQTHRQTNKNHLIKKTILIKLVLEQSRLVPLTCDCNQSSKKFYQSQNKGDAKVTRQRKEERVAICDHWMLI